MRLDRGCIATRLPLSRTPRIDVTRPAKRLILGLENNDPYDLARFVKTQQRDYAKALSEIKAGRKTSHWMWYVFPQIEGLGFSTTSKRFAIKSGKEAKAYLDHPVLGRRLEECAGVLLSLEDRSAHEIFGSPDDLKLRSSATLFAHVSPEDSVFHRLLSKYFAGDHDVETLRLLGLAQGKTH